MKINRFLACDITGLYGVNSVDYAEIAAHWGQTGCPTGCENVDINNDGTVDINDLMLLANNWFETDCEESNNWCSGRDFDKSGSVDMLDLATFAGYWLEGI